MKKSLAALPLLHSSSSPSAKMKPAEVMDAFSRDRRGCRGCIPSHSQPGDRKGRIISGCDRCSEDSKTG
jgi:hypothetical protein